MHHVSTTLFAALAIGTGEVVGDFRWHHRGSVFLQFLRTIEVHVPSDWDIHLVVDNHSTHKKPQSGIGLPGILVFMSTSRPPLRRG